jgi:hypothetical protein
VHHPPYHLPRVLILLGSLWLIGSWAIAIGLRPPVQQTSASYEPGVRVMLLGLTAGFVIGWPLFRLSQAAISAPRWQVMLDMMVLVSMLQVVLWPVRLVTTWSTSRTTVIDVTLIAWIAIVGAILAASISSARGGPRVLAMIACIAIGLLAPTLRAISAAIGLDDPGGAYLSPFTSVSELTDAGAAPLSPRHWRGTVTVALAAVAAWTALAAARAVLARRAAPIGPHTS